jgi:hypothetical protein
MRFGYYSLATVPPKPAAIDDVIIDDNAIDHSPVGIEFDRNAEGVVLSRNSFVQVAEQRRLAAPHCCMILR